MFSLRPAESQDEELLYHITEATMRSYVEGILGPWDEQQQRTITRERMNAMPHHLIQIDGEDIGMLAVMRSSEVIRLESLFLLPKAQKQGVGRAILHQLKAEAEEKGQALRLHVLANNPARLWYEREGFTIMNTTPERIFMEYKASRQAG